MVGAALLAFYFKVKNSENDSVWKVKKEELTFPDPQQVIGSGTFGLVLLAEYRGTQVAIKRVLPPKNTDAKSLGKRSTISGSSIEGSFDTNDSSDENSPYECKRLGTTSWGGMNVSGVGGMGMLSQQNATRSRIGGRSSLKSGAKSDISAKKQYKALKDDFIKEMRYLSKLRHPCITTVMGAVIPKDNESPMLLMEYMDHVSVEPELACPFNSRLHMISALSHNSILLIHFCLQGSLRDILHNNTIPLEGEILLPMLCDVTQGCRFLHSSDPLVVHGDLKSANILVDSRFRAKVADFGLSVSTTHLCMIGTDALVCGN